MSLYAKICIKAAKIDISLKMKLLTGLYEPTEGEILINGINLRELPVSEKSRIYGVTFQDFGRFCLTLKENITFGEEEENFKQKAALARAMFCDSNILVLDEPTSAIDPMHEAKLYKRFAEMSSHDELLLKKGQYYKFWTAQTGLYHL